MNTKEKKARSWTRKCSWDMDKSCQPFMPKNKEEGAKIDLTMQCSQHQGREVMLTTAMKLILLPKDF